MTEKQWIGRARNTTRSPLEAATPVENPEIKHVLSVKTGQLHDVSELIRKLRYDQYARLRTQVLDALHRGTPRLRCPICRVPVQFASSPDKRVFFRHRVEDGRCPAVTRTGRTQDDLREMVYQGRQESRLHLETKQLIADSLEADPNFSQVAVEATWRAAEGLSRRRPDVSAIWREGIRIAFEAQLTTTFLDVVVRRRSFYAGEGGLLVWILRSFDPSYRRQTEDDIFFSNNSNVLVVDTMTAQASRDAGRFMVRVHHRALQADGQEGWADELVPFADLTLDVTGQRAFLYDFEGAERLAAARARQIRVEAEERRLEEERKQREAARARLRAKVLDFFGSSDDWTSEDWPILRDALRSAGVRMDSTAEDLWSIRGVIHGLMSGAAGTVIGFRYQRLIQVANYLYDHHRGAVCAFLALVDINGHRPALTGSGDQSKWAAREAEVMAAYNAGNASARLQRDIRPLVAFLFPSLR